MEALARTIGGSISAVFFGLANAAPVLVHLDAIDQSPT
jgi:hypothetical protein